MTDYLEDALPAAERARFEAHLAECDGCTAYLEDMREMVLTLGEMPVRSRGPRDPRGVDARGRDAGILARARRADRRRGAGLDA